MTGKMAFTGFGRDWRIWLRAMRVHQYAKNALLLVPAFTAHSAEVATVLKLALAIAAFSLAASSVYLVNDVLDLDADRLHPSKRHRPLASGQLTRAACLSMAAGLLIVGALLASAVSAAFLATLAVYVALSTAYSLWLKSQLAVDVVALAALYTLRIIAGGVAAQVVVSEWLLIFAIFVFTSLALLKRWVELKTILDKGLPDPSNRNYKAADLPIVAALAAASAMNSVTIFALYVSASPMIATYQRPWALWLICPLLLYWLARALMLAHRGAMHDDPVVFALRDPVSWLALFGMVGVVMFAM